jgi:hypothetical protein
MKTSQGQISIKRNLKGIGVKDENKFNISNFIYCVKKFF